MMKIDMNQTIKEFISANSKITQNYFTFIEKVLDRLDSSPNRQQTLSRLLEQTENVTQTFLDTNRQLFKEERMDLPSIAQELPESGHNEVIQSSVNAVQSAEECPPEQWLREKLAEVTGFAKEGIDFTLDFDQLGIDSLNRLDLQEELTQLYPHVDKTSLYVANTPEKLLNCLSATEEHVFCAEQIVKEAIAHHTGFAPQDIDLSLSFDELGLDSLNRLDVLDDLQADFPEIKPYVQQLMNLSTPQEIVDVLDENLSPTTLKNNQTELETSLAKLLKEFSKKESIDKEAPFSDYLPDGFIQHCIWENLAAQYDLCQFAGESLMSRRNANEALTLLNRLG